MSTNTLNNINNSRESSEERHETAIMPVSAELSDRDVLDHDTKDNQEREAELWESSQGYSPLTDMNLITGDPDDDAAGVFMFSEGPDSSGNTTPSFFAVGDNFQATMEEEEEEEEEEENNTDLIAVADQALAALDADYLSVLQQGRLEEEPKPLDLPSHDASPLFSKNDKDDEFLDQDVAVAADDETAAPATESLPSDSDGKYSAGDGNLIKKEIDTQAVRKAVQAIHLNDPKLSTAFAAWEEQQQIIPRDHALIPKASLAAFRKKTTKAIKASANLSRSATIAQALVRLQLMSKPVLHIHVIGCDRVECETEDRIRTFFGPLVRWLSAGGTNVQLRLLGPGVPERSGPIISCHRAVYHEWLQDHEDADLVIAFNAGVWGYNEWRTTIQMLVQRKHSIPFVVTAYTLYEAQDDAEVIQEEVACCWSSKEEASAACLWAPEINPFSSRVERPTQTAVAGRIYRENSAWQAWSL
jgi:hypothetical protein